MSDIIFLTGGLGRGGQENQLLLLLDCLHKKSHTITLVNWSGICDESNLERLGSLIDVESVDLGKENIFIKIKHLYLIYSKGEIIVSFTSYLNMISFIIATICGKKSFGAARIQISYELKRPLGWLNLLMVPRIISNSKVALSE